jgi:pyruvate,water dikinase
MKIGSKKRNDFISLSEGEPAFQQALSTDKIKMVASTSLKVEKVFKHPQDIEWCIWRDKLWLLQSRAITGTQK